MGGGHPERQVFPSCFAERDAAQLDAHFFVFDQPFAADAPGAALLPGGFVEAEERESGALRACSVGAGWEGGELHAVRSDVRLEAAETPLSTVRAVCLRQLFRQGEHIPSAPRTGAHMHALTGFAPHRHSSS